MRELGRRAGRKIVSYLQLNDEDDVDKEKEDETSYY